MKQESERRKKWPQPILRHYHVPVWMEENYEKSQLGQPDISEKPDSSLGSPGYETERLTTLLQCLVTVGIVAFY
jgi:hypothetical protein